MFCRQMEFKRLNKCLSLNVYNYILHILSGNFEEYDTLSNEVSGIEMQMGNIKILIN